MNDQKKQDENYTLEGEQIPDEIRLEFYNRSIAEAKKRMDNGDNFIFVSITDNDTELQGVAGFMVVHDENKIIAAVSRMLSDNEKFRDVLLTALAYSG